MDLANKVYAAACRLILLCHQLGVHWSVQQPARSIFWLTSFWKTILAVVTPWIVTFHSCMFGGMRPKKTSIASDLECLQALSAECTNQHVHLPWGVTPWGSQLRTRWSTPSNYASAGHSWCMTSYSLSTLSPEQHSLRTQTRKPGHWHTTRQRNL